MGFYAFSVTFSRKVPVRVLGEHREIDTLQFLVCKYCEKDVRSLIVEHIPHLIGQIRFLHSRGIFHRDVKRDNVMICDGKAMLIDFGNLIFDDGNGLSYKPMNHAHPLAYHYFMKSAFPTMRLDTVGKFVMNLMGNAVKASIKSRSVTTKSRVTKMPDVFNFLTNADKRVADAYMMSKDDCFGLVVVLKSFVLKTAFLLPLTDGLVGGGGFTCFGKASCSAKYSPVADYREKLVDTCTDRRVAQLLYIDKEDFDAFEKTYMRSRSGGARKMVRSRLNR
jgi:serine/threonine protein kinase